MTDINITHVLMVTMLIVLMGVVIEISVCISQLMDINDNLTAISKSTHGADITLEKIRAGL